MQSSGDFNRKVAQSKEKGFTPTVIYVYNDAETGYTNCMERLIASNRAVRYGDVYHCWRCMDYA